MGENPWLFQDLLPMETSLPLWSYHESVVVEELKQKLICTTMELETLRNNAKEEIRKSEENINKLILLLNNTGQERDKLRDQVQILLNKMRQQQQAPSSSSPVNIANACLLQPETQHMMLQIRGNSSLTESDTLSETPKQQQQQQPHQSSDSFFDGVSSSPDISGNVHDQADAIIDRLASENNLPENGKFLQYVMEAGPLLQTLLVAGPLPRWRNPPPLQPFQIPPVSVKCCNAPPPTAALNHPNYLMHCSSASMLSFKRSGLPSCGLSSYQNLSAKRQKSQ